MSIKSKLFYVGVPVLGVSTAVVGGYLLANTVHTELGEMLASAGAVVTVLYVAVVARLHAESLTDNEYLVETHQERFCREAGDPNPLTYAYGRPYHMVLAERHNSITNAHQEAPRL